MIDIQLAQPPGRHLGQHGALIWYRLLHHDVEGADPVGGDEKQAVAAGVIDLPDLSAPHMA